MSRRHAAEKREVLPDAKFGDIVVTKFMNCIMEDGKKSVAERILYGAFEIIQKRTGKNPLEVFHEALGKVGPVLEVRSRRVGGATLQVPNEVRPARRGALAIRWIVEAATKRSEKTMENRVAAELLDASQDRGAARKKHEDTLRMAESNKAYAHYRW